MRTRAYRTDLIHQKVAAEDGAYLMRTLAVEEEEVDLTIKEGRPVGIKCLSTHRSSYKPWIESWCKKMNSGSSAHWFRSNKNIAALDSTRTATGAMSTWCQSTTIEQINSIQRGMLLLG